MRDDSKTLSIEEVRQMSFTPLATSSSPNFGFDRSAYWFQFDVANESSLSEWLLEVAYAPLDQIDLYVVSEDKIIIHKTSGDHFPIAQRDLVHRHPIFALEIAPQQVQKIFLRVQTISSFQVPLTFWHRGAFLRTSYNIQMLNGLFYGAMLLMILYQFFLYLSAPVRITLYYVLTLLTMINVVAFFQGYPFLYVYPGSPWINDIFAIVTGPLFVVCSTLLTRAFLNVRSFSKLLDNLILGNMFADLGIMLLTIIFFRKISFEYHNYLIFLHCLLALVAAGYCFYKKYKPARYYLIAWFTPLVAAGVFTISSVGLMPGFLGTNYTGLMIGCILQMLFISLALGDRWRSLEKENQRAKELEFIREQEENERLEKEVILRTTEIHKQNIQLEEVNNVKDKLFSVVSHDIKGPLNSLHLALTLAKSGSLSSEEFQQLSGRLELRLMQTSEFIDNLLQWAKLQMRGETFEPDKLDLVELANETVRLLEPECLQKKIKLVNNLDGTLHAFADLNMMRSVIRNLLTNAIKFTSQGGSIIISAYQVDAKIIISVADTGVGIPSNNRERLFTPITPTTQGTQQEKGTGLGLLLCKQFVEKNGGRIWFESEVGKGTTFYFSLPMYNQGMLTANANA
jgi:signal transduction histidine kinase